MIHLTEKLPTVHGELAHSLHKSRRQMRDPEGTKPLGLSFCRSHYSVKDNINCAKKEVKCWLSLTTRCVRCVVTVHKLHALMTSTQDGLQ